MTKRILIIFLAAIIFSGMAPGQTISTLAGNGSQGYGGDDWYAIWAEFNCPNNIIAGYRRG